MIRILLFLATLSTTFSVSAIGLDEAILSGKVKAIFQSTGMHFGPCVRCTVENNSIQPINIEIEPGMALDHEDSIYQNHLIADEKIFVLNKKERKTFILNAFCTERTDRCPADGSSFRMIKQENKLQKDLAKIISANKQMNFTGQEAIWSLINKTTPNDIYGEDSTAIMQLRNFIGKALNFKVNPFDPNKYLRPAQRDGNKLSIETSGNHYVRDVSPGDTITYALYDSTNHTISEIKTDIAMVDPYKKHNVRWHFTAERLNPESKYYLRIKVNGVVYKEWLYKFMG